MRDRSRVDVQRLFTGWEGHRYAEFRALELAGLNAGNHAPAEVAARVQEDFDAIRLWIMTVRRVAFAEYAFDHERG